MLQSTNKSHKYLKTDHLKSSLRQQSIRGGVVTVTSQIVRFLLQTIGTVFLARLLTPQDYGLLAMVTAFAGFIALFQDMGLSVATIQKAEISIAQVSNLFWINTSVGVCLGLLLAGFAPIISWFYSEPRLTSIVLVLATSFLFSGMTVQHQALLSRQMRFSAKAICEIASAGIGTILGVVMAWYGLGYWALVGLSVTTVISKMILVWVFCGWWPSLPARDSGMFAMVAFGGHIVGFDIFNYFARNSDKILLGRLCGPTVLGLYDKAYNLMMLPIAQIQWPLSSVALPALSHIQNDPVRFRSYFLKLVTLTALITMPLMTYLFIFADHVILIILGTQWLEAIDIFKVLCIVALIKPMMGSLGLVQISLGKTRDYLYVGIINSLFTIIAFIIGIQWGAMGLAISYTCLTYVLFVPVIWYSFTKTPLTVSDFFYSICRPLCASSVMYFILIAFRSNIAFVSNYVLLGLSFVIGSLTYFMILVLVPGGLSLLKEVYSYRYSLFQEKA